MELLPVQASSIGMSLLDIGLMGTGAAAAYTVMTLVAGSLLDRFEKLRTFLFFNILTLGSLIMLVFARDFSWVFSIRILLGFLGGAFWTAAGALTAEISPPEILTHAIGRYNLSWILGFVFGPFIGGMIADTFGYSSLWLVMVILMIGGVAVNFSMISKIRLYKGAKKTIFDFGAVYNLRYAYLTMIPYALGLGIYFYILPGYMAESGISATIIGVLMAMSSAVKGVGFYYSEKIVGLGSSRGLFIGAVLLCVSLGAIGLASTAIGFVIPLALFGISNGFIEPIILDYIAHGSPRNSLGTTMGVYEGMYGAFTCLSPMVAGFVSQSYPTSTVYITLGVISILIIPGARKLRGNVSEKK